MRRKDFQIIVVVLTFMVLGALTLYENIEDRLYKYEQILQGLTHRINLLEAFRENKLSEDDINE